jgi:hypothetical protein
MLEDSYEIGGGVLEVVIAHLGTSLFMFSVLWFVENKYYESPVFSCLRSATISRSSFCIKIQYMCLQMTQNAV